MSGHGHPLSAVFYLCSRVLSNAERTGRVGLGMVAGRFGQSFPQPRDF